MMLNLFSMFDPCTGMMSLNWMITIMFMLIMNYNYWTSLNNMKTFLNKMEMMIYTEMFILMPIKGSTMLFLTLFIFILFNNMMGLMPYVFTSSAHMIFSLSISLPMWSSFIMFGMISNTNKMMSHMLPMSTPSILMPFMVIIESLSSIIRPGSLSVRLTANMIAGHMIMNLMGSNLSMTKYMMMMIMFTTIMLFELAVSIIQSYVFMTLITLYSSEV